MTWSPTAMSVCADLTCAIDNSSPCNNVAATTLQIFPFHCSTSGENVISPDEPAAQEPRYSSGDKRLGTELSFTVAITLLSMSGRKCYHCKQWIEDGEEHDCWTTSEAALTQDLSDDLRDAWERLRETAVSFGEQRIYASHKAIMFS